MISCLLEDFYILLQDALSLSPMRIERAKKLAILLYTSPCVYIIIVYYVCVCWTVCVCA